MKTVSIHERPALVHSADFAKPLKINGSMADFFAALPQFLAARDLRAFARHIHAAKQAGKPIIWGMGAHVVKVGLAPIIIQLMQHGFINTLAVNGAFMIHDAEIALCGSTSENVADQLPHGSFGITRETSETINAAMLAAADQQIGLGEAVARHLLGKGLPFAAQSIMIQAQQMHIPITVHSAIGTDFIHFHPAFRGDLNGAMSQIDFSCFAARVAALNDGGVYLNIGSAVLLPEVFLKAVAYNQACGVELRVFYTAVFDFIRQYRPLENVSKRPVQNGGKGYYFIGHHELMLPLLSALLLCET